MVATTMVSEPAQSQTRRDRWRVNHQRIIDSETEACPAEMGDCEMGDWPGARCCCGDYSENLQNQEQEDSQKSRAYGRCSGSQEEPDQELQHTMKQRQRKRLANEIFLARCSPTVHCNVLLLVFGLLLPVFLTSVTMLAECSMCQYQQAASAAAAAAAVSSSHAASPAHQMHLNSGNQNLGIVVCPKSSQFNNLPQFPSLHQSPKLERQQRAILKNLNESFANHLQLNGPADQPSSVIGGEQAASSELVDDQLLNEIISPIVLDAAYERAKELIVKRRKLESELIRQGKCRVHLASIQTVWRNPPFVTPFTLLANLSNLIINVHHTKGQITDMSKPTAVARHQRVTTTTTRGNELEKAQEVFEEMSRILALK